MLVNGVAIAQSVIPAKGGRRKGEEEEETRYTLDLRTEDQRTVLTADHRDHLWIYGQVLCNKPEVDTAALTRGLTFTPEGTCADWLVLGQPTMSGEFKTVRARARPPFPEAQLTDPEVSVVVSAFIEGRKISGPVTLQLEPELIMEFV